MDHHSWVGIMDKTWSPAWLGQGDIQSQQSSSISVQFLSWSNKSPGTVNSSLGKPSHFGDRLPMKLTSALLTLMSVHILADEGLRTTVSG